MFRWRRLTKTYFFTLWLCTWSVLAWGVGTHKKGAPAVPCELGGIAPVPPQKPLPESLQKRIETYLDKAIAAKRTFGIEIEFGGLNTQGDVVALTKALNGKLDGGMIQIKPDAKPRVILTKYAADGVTPEEVQIEAEAVDGQKHVFTWVDWGVLKTPGTNWIEGIWSPEEAMARVESWKGKDAALAPNTFIRGTALGDVDIHSEPVGKGKAGIELVTPPITYDRMGDLQNVQLFLNGRAKGVREGFSSGVHVNIGLQHEASELHPKILRRLILRWSAIRGDVLKRFEPSPIRASPIDNNRPFYGDYSPEFLADLRALGEEGATREAFNALFEKHYPDLEVDYRGKWFDVNPVPIMKGQTRVEFRLFNADFMPGQEKYLKDAVDICLSMVEQAVREPLP